MNQPRRGSSTDTGVEAALRTLTPLEEQVLRMRYGIGSGMHTVEGPGEQSGVARARLRQIETRALRKLRATALPGLL